MLFKKKGEGGNYISWDIKEAFYVPFSSGNKNQNQNLKLNSSEQRRQ